MRFWRRKACPKVWETGLLKHLEKKGDLSLPGNYRGIMLLEVPYKVIANILKARLTVISEQLDHEMQNGFRPGRSTTDGIFKIVLRKMKEHGHAVWMLLLDLIKAFDRCPRELLWPLMVDVPPNLISVLQALIRLCW
jgi:sorting nexin-29